MIKGYLNQNRSIAKNILFIVVGIGLFLIFNSILKVTYSLEYLYDLYAIYMLILAIEYFGVMLIIFSLNKHNKWAKYLRRFVLLIAIIYSFLTNTTEQQFIVTVLTIIGLLLVIIFKKPLIIFIIAFFYTVIGVVLSNVAYSTPIIMTYLDNNSYLVLFVFIILSMAIFYLTGARVCNYIDKVFFKEFYLKENENQLKRKIETSELKNYVYLLYFIFYFTYYMFVFASNNSLSEETSILINALLITVLAMYQIDWIGLFKDLNDGWIRLKGTIKKMRNKKN